MWAIMSSGFQPTEPQSFGLATDEDVDSPEEDKQAEAGKLANALS